MVHRLLQGPGSLQDTLRLYATGQSNLLTEALGTLHGAAKCLAVQYAFSVRLHRRLSEVDGYSIRISESSQALLQLLSRKSLEGV